MLLTIAVVVML